MRGAEDRQVARRWDVADPLAEYRQRFCLPPGLVYLDGNSLGPPALGVAERVQEVLCGEWGRDLVASWNVHCWMDLPRKTAHRLAPFLGVSAQAVAVTDSTSVNLFKLLTAALLAFPERRLVVSTQDNFPSDIYIADAVARQSGGKLEVVPAEELEASLDEQVAVVLLSQVDFRTGVLHDLSRIAAAAHRVGALLLADVSHSVGVMPLSLEAWGVDLAVGCGYKFLGGGPGAPAFLYVEPALLPRLQNPIPGWLGHREPFAFQLQYLPADDNQRFLCGTPPILSLSAFEASLRALGTVDLQKVRDKSQCLGDTLILAVEQLCSEDSLQLVSPRQAELRGSQVSFRHPHAYAVVQALAARRVLADFREPDLIRCGLAPLYLGFGQMWDVAEAMRTVLENREWDEKRHRDRRPVT